MKGIHYQGIGNTRLTTIDFCNKTWGWMLEPEQGFLVEPQKTVPTSGEHDFNTCIGCQDVRRELIKRLTEKFNGSEQHQGFPFCCSQHSNLIKLKEFNRASFFSVPEMVADKIIYSIQHIINNYQNESYYKDITDYIEYTIESFGQMPTGCGGALFIGEYFIYVVDLLTRNPNIQKERKSQILEYLEVLQTPPTQNRNTDLNILLSTYQKWFKVFPFEISFFSTLKPHFENQFPILNGKPETNKFTGLTKAKMHTKGSLIDVLLKLTDNLLTQINTYILYEKGQLTEPQKIKLELVLNERKMKLKQGYVNSSRDEEQRYRRILKEWFADEIRFIDKVTPIVKALPPIKSETVTEKYTAKHYLLAYLFECNAKGESYPIGNKRELERIGNERMGAGKGNRFYKVFNEVIQKDLNAENNLFEIGGEYWRKAVIELSKAPELVENYLQSKQL